MKSEALSHCACSRENWRLVLAGGRVTVCSTLACTGIVSPPSHAHQKPLAAPVPLPLPQFANVHSGESSLGSENASVHAGLGVPASKPESPMSPFGAGATGSVHSKPGSIWQLDEHPSPSAALPSSHCSPSSSRLSPHTPAPRAKAPLAARRCR